MTVETVEPQGGGPNPGLLLASEAFTGRVRKLLAAYYAGAEANRQIQKWRSRARSLVTYTVSVPGDDVLYPDLHRLLLARMPDGRRKALIARTRERGGGQVEPESNRSDPATLSFFYDGTSEQSIDLDGHRVSVQVEKPNDPIFVDERSPAYLQAREKIVFTARSLEGRRAVERMLAEVARARAEQPPTLWVANAWNWNRLRRKGTRPLSSVVLAEGRLEFLLEDLRQFLGAEEKYEALGLPYHRGYLFHGPPGTGKTSTARALADELRLDCYYLPLSVIQNDARLVDLLGSVDPRSLLILEDVDIVHGARLRDDVEDGVTLSGLLNALDGFVTPHGLVTVMTTNDVDVLDEALVRPGRVDADEPFGTLDEEQFGRLVRALLPDLTDWSVPGFRSGVTPAEVIDHVKRHLDAPDLAWEAIVRTVSGSSALGRAYSHVYLKEHP